jgi:hypothetical protein
VPTDAFESGLRRGFRLEAKTDAVARSVDLGDELGDDGSEPGRLFNVWRVAARIENDLTVCSARGGEQVENVSRLRIQVTGGLTGQSTMPVRLSHPGDIELSTPRRPGATIGQFVEAVESPG